MVLVPFITTVLGCGVVQPASTRNFTVSGFKLAVPMVAYTGMGNSIPAEAPGIARNKEAAKAFVERLVMQTVTDVLKRQGRSAILPDTVISAISEQLRIQINYDPLVCKGATVIKDEDTENDYSVVRSTQEQLDKCSELVNSYSEYTKFSREKQKETGSHLKRSGQAVRNILQ
ncbi:hypothetical protein KIN20_023963 [Parelaphostrongylus tenuis]|uniref:Uncharacterized protein n=1 Tax=Parelaphostrongylus tenuis TaxID=148309 RepID=A0AAD5N7Q2_PARTN|nr:hypothetical protein KIN20_023963 [Parelaphostrongylus tenuis]